MKNLACVLMALSYSATLLAADPFAGTWKLDVAKSTYQKGQEPKEVTVVIVEQGDNAVVTAKGTAADGKPIAIKYSLPMKGGTQVYTEGAPPAGVSVTGKRVNTTTIDATTTMNGKIISTTHTTLSADGKTMTQVRKGVSATGASVDGTAIYTRQ